MDIDVEEIKLIADNSANKYSLFYDDKIVSIPKSIAIILDGNGRYAIKKNIPRSFGHKAGCEALEIILEEAVKLNVKYLTVYAFSTENWKRSEDEVSALMTLLRSYT